jgi:hypothetical protein
MVDGFANLESRHLQLKTKLQFKLNSGSSVSSTQNKSLIFISAPSLESLVWKLWHYIKGEWQGSECTLVWNQQGKAFVSYTCRVGRDGSRSFDHQGTTDGEYRQHRCCSTYMSRVWIFWCGCTFNLRVLTMLQIHACLIVASSVWQLLHVGWLDNRLFHDAVLAEAVI